MRLRLGVLFNWKSKKRAPTTVVLEGGGGKGATTAAKDGHLSCPLLTFLLPLPSPAGFFSLLSLASSLHIRQAHALPPRGAINNFPCGSSISLPGISVLPCVSWLVSTKKVIESHSSLSGLSGLQLSTVPSALSTCSLSLGALFPTPIWSLEGRAIQLES